MNVNAFTSIGVQFFIAAWSDRQALLHPARFFENKTGVLDLRYISLRHLE